MRTSGQSMTWLPTGSSPVSSWSLYVPKEYSDRGFSPAYHVSQFANKGTATGHCVATVKFSFGDFEKASYNEIWGGATAVYWMCVRSKQQDGVSTGHGRHTHTSIDRNL